MAFTAEVQAWPRRHRGQGHGSGSPDPTKRHKVHSRAHPTDDFGVCQTPLEDNSDDSPEPADQDPK